MKTCITILLVSIFTIVSNGQNFQFTIGTPDTISLVPEMTPYPTTYRRGKVQYLYLASELTATGNGAFTATSIAMEFVEDDTQATSYQMCIRIGHTNRSDMSLLDTTLLLLPLNICYNSLIISQGTVSFSFLNQPFTWDGQSNVIVECTYMRSASPGLAPRAYVDTGLTFLASRHVLDSGFGHGQLSTETLPGTAVRGSFNSRPVMTWAGISGTTFVADHDPENELTLYPNPCSNEVQVRLPLHSNRIELYNSTGQLIRVEELRGQRSIKLNTSNEAIGLYHLLLRAKNGDYLGAQQVVIHR